MTKLGLVVAVAVGTAVFQPLPSTAAAPGGEQAVAFTTFEAEVPAGTVAELQCEYGEYGTGARFFFDVSTVHDAGWGRMTGARSHGPGVGGGVSVRTQGVDVPQPKAGRHLGGRHTVTWTWTASQSARQVRAAAAVFSAPSGLCRMSVGGVEVAGEDLPLVDARIFSSEDFGGVAGARVGPAVEATVRGSVGVDAPGVLTSMVTVDPTVETNTFRYGVVRPDGTRASDGEMGGPAGRWTFEAHGVLVGQDMPLLWTMKLPAAFSEPRSDG